ncbi:MULTISPECIES: tRNA epoxyqueuosine(34) reductase QueG [Prochlorococcus]|uniref:Epoxyqueuosine (OQ) reductase QueG n=1 Tax=Prochlorococcus marinus str. MIT 9116 TaxID=167544 RepID=A0A0A1ZWV4_PROMR|nr:tRNA epoxyqueuosine(34) reductase QueG [Prochlorococcus marinus]KGF89435.1 Epoxyqueuosine (oQ) reductase QueG [Prochlorococcus marinus str. MIT 9107]KGF92608.1 Epoxyqueuosine (oQ) reductase QueG [Prochlorococcus marinus str. MIT 9116]KGF95686.1 Epoxyqueuosine (oQ) reductase QueG [Prochlorococcus marinus str. MIT 9123]
MTNTIQEKKDVSKKLKERAIIEGFAISGIAAIPGSPRLKLRTKALDRWLSNNHHSDMKWMEAERRKNIGSLLDGAKSVLSVGFTYISSQNNNKDKIFKVGKFGQGEDYHKVIYKKLKNIGKWINLEIPDCKWKICVDTSPLLEKAWAEESGLGWIGKNSNLISTKNGSWFTLGFMILTKDLVPDKPHQSLCGKCDKCIEQCPTKAIVEPFVIQSDLCIAYHTIENREETIPKKIKENLNGWIAGCDICQDICPWNKSVPHNNTFETKPKKWINNLNIDSLDWDDKTWEENLQGTTLKRIKPWMWRRNIKATLASNPTNI